ncbi:MAG: MbnP family copper-binding protein [Cyanobacteria bacterium P01_A01_bin.116]
MVNSTCKGKLLKLVAGAGVAAIAFFPSADTTANAVESQRVSIQFEGAVGSEPFACGETYRVGTEDSAITPLDFRLYVSEVALIDAAGNTVPVVLEQDGLWQHQNVALLDFEDKTGSCANGTPETRAEVVGAVPAGDYSGLKFTLGVPFALNHIDSTLAPSPLNLTSLWWNWNFGYKFARVDMEPVNETAMAETGIPEIGVTETGISEIGVAEIGVTETSVDATKETHSSTSAQAFAIHIGSVGCQMDAAEPPVNCSSPHRADVMFTDFDPAQDVVVTDLSALVANTNLNENQEGTPIGCMSGIDDNDCMGIMQSLGLPFQDQPETEQTFFRVK